MSKKKKFNKYLRKGGRFLLRKKIINDAYFQSDAYFQRENKFVMTEQEIKDYPYLNPSTGRFWGDTIDIEDIKRQIKELEKKEKI